MARDKAGKTASYSLRALLSGRLSFSVDVCVCVRESIRLWARTRARVFVRASLPPGPRGPSPVARDVHDRADSISC